MNTLNSSNDDAQECPLCLEPLEVDDLNFYPCTCGYQICRFCWHRIRTGENELCPACRKAYPENPADFTPLSQEQIAALKAEKRQRDQQKKQKVTENRKHLANVRVVQKNLVFVVGLPPRLADADILKKHEYFGKYGKIHKVVINPSTTYAGVQGPSASAYVTYLHNNDSLRAIQSVNNIMIDGRLIKTSLGTTKYCSHFMKNQQCPKPDCMYLHELGDPEASFTKEEMHQGKHQEYEKRLHDTLIAATANGVGGGSSLGVGLGVSSEKIHNSNSSSSGNEKGGGADSSKLSSKQQNGNIQSKDAWPSLSESPVSREMRPTKNGKDKDRNENRKHEKTKSEKARNKKEHKNNHNTGAHNSLEKTKDHQSNGKLSTAMSSSSAQSSSLNNKQTETHIRDDETHLIDDIEQDALSDDAHVNDGRQKRGLENTPSLSSSSSPSSASESSESGTLSETPSRVNSPGSFPDHPMQNAHHNERLHNHLKNHLISARQVQLENNSNIEPEIQDEEVGNIATNDSDNHKINISSSSPKLLLKDANVSDPSVRFSKLNLFDDNNSFFSSASYQPFLNSLGENNQTTNSPQLPDLLNGTESDKDRSEREDSKMNIFKGLSGYHSQQLNDKFGSSTFNTTEEWEAAFKYMMMRTTNNKQQHQMDAQEELMRSHEFQKRNNIINSLAGVNHYSNNGPNDYNFDYDFCRAATMLHQQQQQQQPQQRPLNSQMHLGENIGQGHVYPSNMSKFFDFHKSQQQQFIMNSHNPSEHLNMGSNGIENNRVQQQQTQFIDQSSGFNGIQMPQHKRLVNKIEPYGSGVGNNHASMIPQNRIPNQFQSDDDLGFDPFVEGQKALAELMENEMVQQQSQPNNSFERTRMPPPGFNHMNAFGFGVPRAQGSKILPFMNSQGNWNQAVPQNPPQHQHMGFQQQQPPPQQNNDHNLGNNKNFSGSMADWTMYDPAIVSFRQFPQFLSGSGNGGAGVPPPQQQQQPADIFMGPLPPPHITQQQQQQQQGGQGFGPHGMNLSNSIINQQQNSPAQVNYSHTNWLNADQNIFMNNLTNGFSNNYDKFSIPMPPGFQANVGASSKQQKAECIN